MIYSIRKLLSRFSTSTEPTSVENPLYIGEPRSSPAAAAAAARQGTAVALNAADDPASDDILQRINRAIDEVRPAIRMDGGDIELVGFGNGTATVRLMGACRSCPMSEMTLQLGVERVIREMVPEVERIEAV